MVRISVITPTMRDGGLELCAQGLKAQTFKDFEWIIVSEMAPLHRQFGFDAIILDAPRKKRFSNLNASLNEGLKRAKGELIVMLQDFIKPNPDGLQKFWDFYQDNQMSLITGPVGKTTDFRDTTWEWRASGELRRLDSYAEWEADWAAAPRDMFLELGGYDELYDNGWSWDNVNLAFRASRLGYDFWNDPTNKALAYDHDAKMEHPYRKNPNKEFHTKKVERILAGLDPIKVNYL